VKFPKNRVRVLAFRYVTWWPAWAVLGLWFGLQVFNQTLSPNGAGGVAYGAHIGGFITGVIWILALAPTKRAQLPY
jgi:membrane associated rhomboid family serine protease